jgi:hypothetical protein
MGECRGEKSSEYVPATCGLLAAKTPTGYSSGGEYRSTPGLTTFLVSTRGTVGDPAPVPRSCKLCGVAGEGGVLRGVAG